MSQYPDPSGVPGMRFRHNDPAGIMPPGMRESLGAPGVAPMPVDTQAQRDFNDLRQSLGLVSQTVGELAGVSAQYARDVRETDAKARAVHQGQASLMGRSALPELTQQIEDRKIIIPEGQDIAEFVDQHLINPRTDGLPEAFREEYTRTVRPSLIAAFVKQHAGIQEQAQTSTLTMLAGRAVQASDAATIDETWKEAKKLFPTLSDDQAIEATVLPAARSAAANGDTVRFEEAKKVLGDRFPAERIRMDAVYADAAAKLGHEQSKAFNSDIDAMYNAGATFDAVRSRIRDVERLSTIDPTVIRANLDEVDRREHASLIQSATLFKDSFLSSEKARVVAAYAPMLAAGSVTGGAPMVKDTPIKMPDGSTHNFKADDIVEAIRSNTWEQIDQQHPPDKDLNENVTAKMQWLSANPGAKDPAMVGAWSGIRQRLPADTDPKTVQPAMLNGYELFKLAGAKNERARNGMIGDADLEFLRTTQFIEENLNLPPANAMVAATNALHRDPAAFSTPTSIGDKLLKDAVSSAAPGAINTAGVRQAIEARARAYSLASGLDPARAVARAVQDTKTDYSVVNGWAVRTRGRNLPSVDLDTVAKWLAAEHATKYPDMKAADLTLIPDGPSGGWRMSYKDTGLPTEHSMVLFDGDLQAIQQELTDQEHSKERDKRIKAFEQEQKTRAVRANANLRQMLTAVRYDSTGFRDTVAPPPGMKGSSDPWESTMGPPTPDKMPPADPAHLRPILDYIRGVRSGKGSPVPPSNPADEYLRGGDTPYQRMQADKKRQEANQ